MDGHVSHEHTYTPNILTDPRACSLNTLSIFTRKCGRSPFIPNRAGPNGSFPLTDAQFTLWVAKYADLVARTWSAIRYPPSQQSIHEKASPTWIVNARVQARWSVGRRRGVDVQRSPVGATQTARGAAAAHGSETVLGQTVADACKSASLYRILCRHNPDVCVSWRT